MSRAMVVVVDRPRARLRALDGRGARALTSAQSVGAARLGGLVARLGAADPARPLAEGYALVRDATGTAVTTARAAARAALVTLEFTDGTITARPVNGEET